MVPPSRFLPVPVLPPVDARSGPSMFVAGGPVGLGGRAERVGSLQNDVDAPTPLASERSSVVSLEVVAAMPASHAVDAADSALLSGDLLGPTVALAPGTSAPTAHRA
ncbi:hypothetical protein EVAR_21963_1 [Eumeta japonica]|uniref:Uncharacterized protein n=1 Tax=Eumeta variegata TaxID=151549 RepID=A0A4C1VU87_EUMVA|nr:hypothetical protein EVAR_21963_1 [Eumeta japonica]